jgi:hypothetical protein
MRRESKRCDERPLISVANHCVMLALFVARRAVLKLARRRPPKKISLREAGFR